jgi:hypothetical protein
MGAWLLRGLCLLLGVMAIVLVALSAAGCGAAEISVGKRSGRYEVLFSPDTEAGWAGWCLGGVGVQGGGCGNSAKHAPVIEESWNGGEEPRETVGIAVTTDEVARVEIGEELFGGARIGDGRSVPTQTETRLPAGLRAVAIKIDGENLLASHGGRPRFIPLNAHGVVIPQSSSETASQLIQPIPTRSISTPADPPYGICEIMTKGHPKELLANRGAVITKVHSYSGFVGEGFISCASTSYELAGWPLVATVLISAAHPGARPSSLPSMRPLPGHPGVFSTFRGQASGSEGELYARRVRSGWLVVSESKPAQRLALLEDLRATVHV